MDATKLFRPNRAIEWRHYICRNAIYPKSNVRRFQVPDMYANWNAKPELGSTFKGTDESSVEHWHEYAPVEYTSPTIHGKPWADPYISDPSFNPKWNAQDGNIDRRSYGRACPKFSYTITDGRPQNPLGRTGITGRGLLGRWGPNHAADAIITRWKTDTGTEKSVDSLSGKGILQFVAIQRRDTKQWAIPGGMVDPGEPTAVTLQREFMEEALNSLGDVSSCKTQEYQKKISELFKGMENIYAGYMDDPRNTDNAWMETTAVNVHDNDDVILKDIPLSAGDDACNVKWMDIDEHLDLYAEHKMLLEYVALLRNARWFDKKEEESKEE